MPRKPARLQSTISFYGDDILALQELEPNQSYVAIAQLCAKLGLNRAAQERRIKSHALLADSTRTLLVEIDDHEERMLCLQVELVPFWLATLDPDQVAEEMRPRLELYQREAASLLWQSSKPQGFGTADTLLPARHEQNPAEQAYVGAAAMATLARHQMLIERQLTAARAGRDEQGADPWTVETRVEDAQAVRLAQAVRRVAHTLAERSRRNEYGGVYTGLYRQFGISSYRHMPAGRLHEALEWLERWHGDLLGIPEPPPDI